MLIQTITAVLLFLSTRPFHKWVPGRKHPPLSPVSPLHRTTWAAHPVTHIIRHLAPAPPSRNHSRIFHLTPYTHPNASPTTSLAILPFILPALSTSAQSLSSRQIVLPVPVLGTLTSISHRLRHRCTSIRPDTVVFISHPLTLPQKCNTTPGSSHRLYAFFRMLVKLPLSASALTWPLLLLRLPEALST